MPEGISAQGTIVSMSHDPNWPPEAPVGGALAFVPIAELREITPPAMRRNMIDMTTHNEEDDARVVGIRRSGDLSFDINFVPTNATHDEVDGLQAAWFEGTRNIYRVEYPDGSGQMASGFVSDISPSAPVDDRLSAQVTIAITGKRSWF